MLALFLLARPRPALGSEQENQKKVLSYYLIDTEFLAFCARKHPDAVEKSALLSPEVRSSLSTMLASCTCSP